MDNMMEDKDIEEKLSFPFTTGPEVVSSSRCAVLVAMTRVVVYIRRLLRDCVPRNKNWDDLVMKFARSVATKQSPFATPFVVIASPAQRDEATSCV